mmetsp:Transcript_6895/g.25733  ORF Transcript_6895/g.25733 Transcript_6895/m.25733 type:complete len:101 (-) Transcript_6895:259-561(-)
MQSGPVCIHWRQSIRFVLFNTLTFRTLHDQVCLSHEKESPNQVPPLSDTHSHHIRTPPIKNTSHGLSLGIPDSSSLSLLSFDRNSSSSYPLLVDAASIGT